MEFYIILKRIKGTQNKKKIMYVPCLEKEMYVPFEIFKLTFNNDFNSGQFDWV